MADVSPWDDVNKMWTKNDEHWTNNKDIYGKHVAFINVVGHQHPSAATAGPTSLFNSVCRTICNANGDGRIK